MAYSQMFRPADRVRFSSPPAAAAAAAPQDFQFFIPDPQVGRRYRFVMRAYLPAAPPDDLRRTLSPHLRPWGGRTEPAALNSSAPVSSRGWRSPSPSRPPSSSGPARCGCPGLAALGCSKPLLVTDRGLVETPAFRTVEAMSRGPMARPSPASRPTPPRGRRAGRGNVPQPRVRRRHRPGRRQRADVGKVLRVRAQWPDVSFRKFDPPASPPPPRVHNHPDDRRHRERSRPQFGGDPGRARR